MNFMAFFGLQRYLHKWGGEYLSKYANEHIAYDFLFLSLDRQTPPIEFSAAQYCRQWEEQYLAEAERIAGQIRQSFRRIGKGPRLLI